MQQSNQKRIKDTDVTKALEKFSRRFQTNESCLRFLSSIKWKDGFICSNCGHINYCKGKKQYSRRCTRCKKEASPTAQTLFHRCKIPLSVAFKVVYLSCKFPDISSSAISRQLNIRQMTCYHFQKKVKECLRNKQEDPFLKEFRNI